MSVMTVLVPVTSSPIVVRFPEVYFLTSLFCYCLGFLFLSDALIGHVTSFFFFLKQILRMNARAPNVKIFLTTIACNLAIWLPNLQLSIRVWTTLYASCSRQFVTQCNSQSGTPILGNKPIILRESYRQRLLFCCVMILVALWKKNFFLALNIVVNNKSKVVQRCLYSYRQRYSSSHKFWPLSWRRSLSIRVQTTPNHFRFVKFKNFFPYI